jgi:hypothetical protein
MYVLILPVTLNNHQNVLFKRNGIRLLGQLRGYTLCKCATVLRYTIKKNFENICSMDSIVGLVTELQFLHRRIFLSLLFLGNRYWGRGAFSALNSHSLRLTTELHVLPRLKTRQVR